MVNFRSSALGSRRIYGSGGFRIRGSSEGFIEFLAGLRVQRVPLDFVAFDLDTVLLRGLDCLGLVDLVVNQIAVATACFIV